MSPSPAGLSCQVDLTLDLASPRTSRRLLEMLLPTWGVSDPDVIERAALVISELVTNALARSGEDGAVTVGAELKVDSIRLWVLDPAPSLPVQRGPLATADDARGLVIVGQIAARWGVEPYADGRRSYADVPLAPVGC